MSDSSIKLLLYGIIIYSLFFLTPFVLVWLISRRFLLKPKSALSNLLYLVIGLIGLWLFNSTVVERSVVFWLIIILLLVSTYALYWKEMLNYFRKR